MDLTQFLDPIIIEKLKTWGYLIMFILLILEGPIISFIASFLASLGIFDFWIVMFLWFLGNIIGDAGFYFFGYFLGKTPHAKKTVETKMMQKLEILAKTHFFQYMILVKFIPYLPMVGFSLAGVLKIPLKKFFLISALLSLLWPIVFWVSGYYIGYVNTLIPKTPLGIFVDICMSILLLTLVYIVYQRVTSKLAQNIEKEL